MDDERQLCGTGGEVVAGLRSSPPVEENQRLLAHSALCAPGGCDEPECVVSLCWMHHRAYDLGEFELLLDLEPLWRAEVAYAVMHLGLIGTVRRLAPGRRARPGVPMLAGRR